MFFMLLSPVLLSNYTPITDTRRKPHSNVYLKWSADVPDEEPPFAKTRTSSISSNGYAKRPPHCTNLDIHAAPDSNPSPGVD
ncbi:hypothetical protein V5O48_012627 [Marasmius crinis-equi]|uniref:Uncharacterized protein n=1 Tax=Marasmius crinis-equi TaxID=585013 RepID=A0ABR3F2J6_9AGAR